MEHLGSRIQFLIKELKLNQAKFASQMGCSSGFLSDVIRGSKKPGADFLSNLSTTFDISLDWLVCGRGNPPIGGTHFASIQPEIFKISMVNLALALEASKGNQTAIDILKSKLNNETYQAEPTDLTSLNDRIRLRMSVFSFLASMYNSKSPTESIEEFSYRVLSDAAKEFDSLTEDPLLRWLNM